MDELQMLIVYIIYIYITFHVDICPSLFTNIDMILTL